MASISSQPTRSISLPARSHPTSVKLEQTLNKLKSRPVFSPDQPTSSSSGPENIQVRILNLIELHTHLQELILSVSTQQGKLLEESMESSVFLLDICSNVREIVSESKRRVWSLQSALRRKGCSRIEQEVKFYMIYRKKMAKEVSKCVKLLKQTENKFGVSAGLLESGSGRVFREVFSVTGEVLRSLLLFLSSPVKTGRWGLLSRLVTAKSSGVSISEVSEIDMSLIDGVAKIDEIRGKIQSLEASLEIFEGEIECLYRCLLKNRVSLLNVLTS